MENTDKQDVFEENQSEIHKNAYYFILKTA